MVLFTRSYVPVMCYVDENWMDIAGNIYPSDGFASAKSFTTDINIQHGLYGILWGKASSLVYEKINIGHWVIVKTEVNNNFIKTDHYNTRVKFKTGMVIHTGSIRTAGKFLFRNKLNRSHHFSQEGEYLKEEQVIGTTKWMKLHGGEE